MTVALVDGDIVAFSCCAYTESWGGPWEEIQADIDSLMKRILETVGATSHETFLSGGNNFRYELYPEYKANRKDKPRPIYLEQAREYLVTAWGAKVTDGYEADDAIGCHATDDCVICSLDKDLLQIPGEHYNWRKNEFTTVSVVDGFRSFFRSVLTGDRTDNIISGLHRMGPVTAGKIINDLTSDWDMYDTCRAIYNNDERLELNCKLLYILREEGVMWRPPVETN